MTDKSDGNSWASNNNLLIVVSECVIIALMTLRHFEPRGGRGRDYADVGRIPDIRIRPRRETILDAARTHDRTSRQFGRLTAVQITAGHNAATFTSRRSRT